MNITVKIEAPELVAAIHSLAGTFGNASSVQVMPKNNGVEPSNSQQNISTVPDAIQNQPYPQNPQQHVNSAVPIAPPNQYMQQTPPPVPLTPPVPQHPAATTVPHQGQTPESTPVQQQVQDQPQQGVPISAPGYKMPELAKAATQLMDAGRQSDLLSLLASFGVQSLMQLPEDQYGIFATKLRELGAKI